jgi:hypothetical protein
MSVSYHPQGTTPPPQTPVLAQRGDAPAVRSRPPRLDANFPKTFHIFVALATPSIAIAGNHIDSKFAGITSSAALSSVAAPSNRFGWTADWLAERMTIPLMA